MRTHGQICRTPGKASTALAPNNELHRRSTASSPAGRRASAAAVFIFIPRSPPMSQALATPISNPPATPDYPAIKQRQQATWASGDYAVIGTTLQIVGETLAEAVDVRAGERVLDVAAGNGNATLAAARRFAEVTSPDYVPELLQKGAARAAAEGLDVYFRTADAEDLPFEEASFD